jgi:hypothetical protein
MNVRHVLSALGVLGIVAAAHTSSATSYYWSHGIDCHPVYGQQNQAGYGEPGIGNFSASSSLRVFCSPEATAPTGGLPTVTNIGVYVGDNNANSPFSCYPYAASNTWGTYWGATKYSCSQYGGCPDSTSSFTGNATINWSSPFNTGSIPAYLGTFDVGVSCTLPPSASYASWIQHVALTGT